MKKFFAIALSALILASSAALASCGSTSESKTEKSSAVQSSEKATDEATTQEDGTTAADTTKAQETTKANNKKDDKKKTSATSKPASSSSAVNNNNKNNNNNNSSSSAPQKSTPQHSSAPKQSSTPKQSSQQSSKPAPKKPSSKPAAAGSFSASDLVFNFNGKTVQLNEDMTSVLSKLGNAKKVTSAQSCHGEGEDKRYEYNGFYVDTYPSGGKDKVIGVTITSGLSTPKGVSVGDSEAKVIEKYGSGFKKIGKFMSYVSGNKSLMFFMNNGKVVEIDYNLDVV